MQPVPYYPHQYMQGPSCYDSPHSFTDWLPSHQQHKSVSPNVSACESFFRPWSPPKKQDSTSQSDQQLVVPSLSPEEHRTKLRQLKRRIRAQRYLSKLEESLSEGDSSVSSITDTTIADTSTSPVRECSSPILTGHIDRTPCKSFQAVKPLVIEPLHDSLNSSNGSTKLHNQGADVRPVAAAVHWVRPMVIQPITSSQMPAQPRADSPPIHYPSPHHRQTVVSRASLPAGYPTYPVYHSHQPWYSHPLYHQAHYSRAIAGPQVTAHQTVASRNPTKSQTSYAVTQSTSAADIYNNVQCITQPPVALSARTVQVTPNHRSSTATRTKRARDSDSVCGSTPPSSKRSKTGEASSPANNGLADTIDKISFVKKESVTDIPCSNSRPRNITCTECSESFLSLLGFHRHYFVRHATDKKSYKCQLCGRTTKSMRVLRHHLISNHQATEFPYVCSKCEAGFFTPANLERHKCRF